MSLLRRRINRAIGFNRPAVVWIDDNKPADLWKSLDVENTALGLCFLFLT
jgi:hypothetical protein